MPSVAMIYQLSIAIAEGSSKLPNQSLRDSQLKGPLTKLLSTSGLWVRAANSERDETRQQLLDLIDRVVALLTS